MGTGIIPPPGLVGTIVSGILLVFGPLLPKMDMLLRKLQRKQKRKTLRERNLDTKNQQKRKRAENNEKYKKHTVVENL